MKKRFLLGLVVCFVVSLAFSAHAAQPAAAETKSLPKITILATGGTIAGSAASSTQLTGYQAGALTAEQLISAVPSLKDFAEIRAEQISSIASGNISIEIWLKIANRINELLAQKDTDGIVITHGTDTMEETAYFLNLVVKSNKPVVLVGSMRPATAISADGPLNLLQAVSVAGSKEAMGRGVLVILNGEINAAREVTKTSTTQPETFRSHDLGYLGYIINNKPVFYRQTLRKHTAETEFDVSKLTTLPKVEIIYNYVAPSLDALNGIVAGKPAGIVSAGTGNGSLFDGYREVLTKAGQSGIVVVRSSRVGTGVVTPDAKDAPGNFVVADNLNPQKARILLMVALTKTKDPKEIQRIFQTY